MANFWEPKSKKAETSIGPWKPVTGAPAATGSDRVANRRLSERGRERRDSRPFAVNLRRAQEAAQQTKKEN